MEKEELQATIEALYAGCKAGDRGAQETLYRMTSSRMLNLCMRYTRDYAEAEEVLQSGYIRVYTQIGQFRQQGAFEGWIRKIIINTAIDFIRRKKRVIPVADLRSLEEENLPVVSAIDNFAYEELLEMIRGLPDGYRTVFNMYVIDGYSHKEIAESLAISEGTSKSQLLRAREWLQRKITKQEGGNHVQKQVTGI